MKSSIILLLGFTTAFAADNGAQAEFSELNARELHNLGTQRLADKELSGSEEALRASLARDQDKLRPETLHNLGHVRFGKGRAMLGGKTKGEVTDVSIARSYVEAADADVSDIEDMIKYLDKAKAEKREPDYVPAISALSSGINTYRTMKKTSIPEAEKQLNQRGSVNSTWTRSLGDFRGAVELNAADTDAKTNADRIEELLRQLRRETESLQEAQSDQRKKLEELRKAITELIKRIPPEKLPEGEGDGDEEDDFGQGKKPRAGGGNQPSDEGDEGKMTDQEARSTLESLRDEFGRKMSTTGGKGGQGGAGKPGDRKGKDY
jgi:hypothetical protein